MSTILKTFAISAFALVTFSVQTADAKEPAQSQLKPAAVIAQKYPKIVLYSVAWCPHCKEAKEYFTKNNIPFINKDVEIDSKAMEELTLKYKSQGVPIIVLGDDKKILKGFNEQSFEKAVKDLQGK